MSRTLRFGDVDDYAKALREALVESPPKVEELLRVHYSALGHVQTYSQLATAVGYANYGGVNSQYGRLARGVASRLGIVARPREGFWGIVIVDWAGSYDPTGTRFRLRTEVVRALERLGYPWANRIQSKSALQPTHRARKRGAKSLNKSTVGA
jgi:hypothetical protein